MQLAFYFDQSRCTGCETCVVACKDWNDIPAGPASRIRVLAIEKGKYPNPFVAFLPILCYHCAQPSCVSACPAGAISKRAENGLVILDQEICLGHDNCDMCAQACPYGAPQFGAEDNAKMQKCDFCADRWTQGKKPICIEACPMRALDAGPEDELKSKYKVDKETTGFLYSKETYPSIFFKPKLDRRLNLGD